MALISPLIFVLFVILLRTFKALNGLLCADVLLRNYSLTGFPGIPTLPLRKLFII